MDELEKSLQELSFEASSSSSDEFEISFQESNLHEHGACSTPVKEKPRSLQLGKHCLTPESKAAVESKPKRLAAYNFSSAQCVDRRQKLSAELENVIEYRDDSNVYVKQSLLMDLLDLTSDDKSMLTRTITALFPGSTKKRVMIESERIDVYTNLIIKTCGRKSVIRKELFHEDNADILELQEKINEIENSLVGDADEVALALNNGDVELAKTLNIKHNLKLHEYFKLQSALVTVYQSKLKMLKTGGEDSAISRLQKEQIEKEIREMESFCILGLKEDGDLKDVLEKKVFSDLLQMFEEKCPLLHSVLQTLLVTDSRKRVHKTPGYKLTCGVNALALLLSVRNQKCKNDIRLLLGLVCITYGAGKQFINLLNAMGLTPHWDTLNIFLEKRQSLLLKTIAERCPDTAPVILLMDNINLYRGRKRHLRLYKSLGPKMWNFTGRAAIIPNIEDFEELMDCKETATMPQTDISSIKVEDLFIDSLPEHKKLWDDWCDAYYLDIIDRSLNVIPTPPKPFAEMSETELNSWISKIDFAKIENERECKYKIRTPSQQELCSNISQGNKTDVINLSLSLENNATLTGTAAIFKEFGKEFSIPCPDVNVIPFSHSDKKFDLTSARTQYEFITSVNEHHAMMKEMETQIRSSEKQMDISAPDDLALSDTDTDVSEDDETVDSVNVMKKTTQEKKDDKFKELYERIEKQVQESIHSNNDSLLDNIVNQLIDDVEKINATRDRYERTVFHYAVEKKNYALVKVLLTVGVNPNAKEGCGATPMTIAVINQDLNMAKLLLDNFAEFEGFMFGTIPSPLEMANAMDLTDIVELFHSQSQANEYLLVDYLKRTESSLTNLASDNQTKDIDMDCDSQAEKEVYVYRRSDYQGFPTAIVGDVGTCKINRSVKHRNNTAYGWSTEIPGDMHAKGHLCEATFKAHGKGGFLKVVNVVMKRSKLSEEAFKKRKFQDQNLNHIQEAVRDASCSYGFAAVQEFKSSNDFPSDDDLKACLRKHGNHNSILLERFKKWLQSCGESDDSHKYHQQLFSLFGPLLQMFKTAGREGDGILRETVWVLLLPIFAQLNFRNYWTEAFVHVVNFTSLWPLAFRKMMRKNSSVNLSGKRGHNIDMDEYVETYIVRPLKTYATGHTSVQMCQRLMANLDLLGSVRKVYSDPEAFNYHQTTQHKEQSPLPDVVKGMWFCIANNFFKVSEDKVALEFPVNTTVAARKPVSKSCMGILQKGEKKVKENFESKLHESFPSFRKIYLESTASNEM